MIDHPPTYCGMPLRRNGALRADAAWVRRQLHDNLARVIPLWRDRNLLQRDRLGRPAACFVEQPHAETILRDLPEAEPEPIYLGHDRNAPVFAADLSHLEERRATRLISTLDLDAEFRDLRAVGALLATEEAAILAYARGITHWHRQTRYCGHCGNSTRAHRGGHLRRCTDHRCAREIFPRINPAVIMLVEQLAPQDGIAKCLLGRRRRIPQRIYSTLAGYVDPGESLEEAVAREVREETGIRICRTTYLASQPWPFPASMMVAFRAQAHDREIAIATDELEDARWFSAAEVRAFGECDDSASSGPTLPRRDSIARTMIEGWLRENGA